MSAKVKSLLGILGRDAVALPFFSAALLLAYLGLVVPAAIIIAVLGFAWNAGREYSRKSRAAADAMALSLAERLAERLRHGEPLLAALERSIRPGMVQHDMLCTALFRYKSSGDASAIERLDPMGSERLRRLFELIASSLAGSENPLNALEELAGELRREESYRMKSIGLMSNYSSVLRLGTAVFFPLFAGISMNVIAFAHASVGGTYASSAQLFAAFAAYAVLANYAGTPRGQGSAVSRAASAAFFGAIAITVMRVASTLSLAV